MKNTYLHILTIFITMMVFIIHNVKMVMTRFRNKNELLQKQQQH